MENGGDGSIIAKAGIIAEIEQIDQRLAELRNDEKFHTVCDGGVARPIKPIQRLQSISAADLVLENIPAMEYLVNEILPKSGLVMVGAPPKSFKSWFCIDAGICVASGSDFLGFKTMQTAVLYLDLESTKRRPRERIIKITSAAPNNFHIITAEQPVDKIGEGLEEQLADQLAVHPDIGLIIIDVFKCVRPAQKRGVNDYDRDYADLGSLKKFADSNGVCILVVHHTRKMKDPDDPFNELAGSTAVFGALDAALVISKKRREDKEAVLHITGRDMDSKALSVVFDEVTLRWRNIGDSEQVERNRLVNEYSNSKIVNVVKRLLMQSNNEITYSVKELIEASQYMGGGMLKIFDSVQKVGLDLVKYSELFETVDGIKAVKNCKDGKGCMTWTFYNILSDSPYSP